MTPSRGLRIRLKERKKIKSQIRQQRKRQKAFEKKQRQLEKKLREKNEQKVCSKEVLLLRAILFSVMYMCLICIIVYFFEEYIRAWGVLINICILAIYYFTGKTLRKTGTAKISIYICLCGTFAVANELYNPEVLKALIFNGLSGSAYKDKHIIMILSLVMWVVINCMLNKRMFKFWAKKAVRSIKSAFKGLYKNVLKIFKNIPLRFCGIYTVIEAAIVLLTGQVPIRQRVAIAAIGFICGTIIGIVLNRKRLNGLIHRIMEVYPMLMILWTTVSAISILLFYSLGGFGNNSLNYTILFFEYFGVSLFVCGIADLVICSFVKKQRIRTKDIIMLVSIALSGLNVAFHLLFMDINRQILISIMSVEGICVAVTSIVVIFLRNAWGAVKNIAKGHIRVIALAITLGITALVFCVVLFFHYRNLTGNEQIFRLILNIGAYTALVLSIILMLIAVIFIICFIITIISDIILQNNKREDTYSFLYVLPFFIVSTVIFIITLRVKDTADIEQYLQAGINFSKFTNVQAIILILYFVTVFLCASIIQAATVLIFNKNSQKKIREYLENTNRLKKLSKYKKGKITTVLTEDEQNLMPQSLSDNIAIFAAQSLVNIWQIAKTLFDNVIKAIKASFQTAGIVPGLLKLFFDPDSEEEDGDSGDN